MYIYCWRDPKHIYTDLNRISESILFTLRVTLYISSIFHSFIDFFLNAVVILDFGFFPPSYALYSIMPFSSNFRNCFVTLYNLRKIISLFCVIGSVCVCRSSPFFFNNFSSVRVLCRVCQAWWLCDVHLCLSSLGLSLCRTPKYWAHLLLRMSSSRPIKFSSLFLHNSVVGLRPPFLFLFLIKFPSLSMVIPSFPLLHLSLFISSSFILCSP
jgi:hypothetical protein